MSWGGHRPGAGRKPSSGAFAGRGKPRTRHLSTPPAEGAPAAPRPVSNLVTPALIERVIERAALRRRASAANPFTPAQHPPAATPARVHQMAMDEAAEFSLAATAGWAESQWGAQLAGGVLLNAANEGLAFLGYPYLSELAQRPEYRVMSETIATEMTRKWIKFNGAEDGDDDKIKQLTSFIEDLGVRDAMADAALKDGFFGRSHLFLDFGDDLDGDPKELALSIGNGRNAMSLKKVSPKRPLRAVRGVEAVWTYPMAYNATNPLRHDWYNPQTWYVMGKEIQCSRLLTFIGRPVPDLLKPAYSFGGLSLSQMAKPYVDIWLTTRESVGELIHAFSVMVLKTDLAALLQPSAPGQDLMSRIALFNATRDNQGAFMVDKNTEDFSNVSAPLSGLHELQAQSQEHMMSVARIPAVKFTGIQPAGLNASSEGEMRAFYDTIAAYQEKFFRPHLTTLVDFAMLSLWGEIDETITFEFVPLWELSEKEKSEKRKNESETGAKYIDVGVISPEEERKRLASDPESGYAFIDPEDVPDLAEEEAEGLMPGGGEGDGQPGREEAAEDGVVPFGGAADEANFEESKHPRDADGKFAAGSGSSAHLESASKQVEKGAAVGISPEEILSTLTSEQQDALADAHGNTLAGIKAVMGAGGGPQTAKPKKSAFGGLWKTSAGGQMAELALNYDVVMGKATNAGSSYRQMLAHMLKQAEQFKLPAMVEPLKKKLGEAFHLAGKKAADAGKNAEAQKAFQKAKQLGYAGGATAPEPSEAKKNAEVAKAAVKQVMEEPATAAEIEKAKSTYGLGKNVVPFVPDDVIKKFNDAYTGKNTPKDANGLAMKVAAFKGLQAFNDAKKAEAEKKAAEEAAKQKAKEAALAKENAEKNKAVMADLGINEQEAVGFNALVGMMGGSQKDVVGAFKQHEAKAKAYGYPVSGFQAALISNYSDGGYKAVNQALRRGSITEAQHVYTKMVNKALREMPTFAGKLRRGTTLTSEQQALYVAGNVVEERAFTSSSISKPFGGNTTFHITAIGKRGAHIKKLSNYPGEDEVLFAARTFFKVTKVEGQPGGAMTVHMEEMDD